MTLLKLRLSEKCITLTASKEINWADCAKFSSTLFTLLLSAYRRDFYTFQAFISLKSFVCPMVKSLKSVEMPAINGQIFLSRGCSFAPPSDCLELLNYDYTLPNLQKCLREFLTFDISRFRCEIRENEIFATFFDA